MDSKEHEWTRESSTGNEEECEPSCTPVKLNNGNVSVVLTVMAAEEGYLIVNKTIFTLSFGPQILGAPFHVEVDDMVRLRQKSGS
jgi:hypothetical protein